MNYETVTSATRHFRHDRSRCAGVCRSRRLPGDDAGFLAALQQDGITYTSPASAIASAHAVCTCLDDGESGLELVHDVKTHNPGFTMDAASEFSLLAAKYYCPHHLSKA